MFKKSRAKIVLSIMGILIALFVLSLAGIAGASYLEIIRKNGTRMERYVEGYTQNGTPTAEDEIFSEDMYADAENESDFIVQYSFCSVEIDEDGTVVAVNNENARIDDTELEKIAKNLLAEGKSGLGIEEDWVYDVAQLENTTLVVLMYNGVMRQSSYIMFRYTLIFGGIFFVLTLFVANYLSGRIVRPMQESYSKQKQFISDAGHELKTPLAILQTNLNLLEVEHGNSAQIDTMKYETQRMNALVQRLLTLSRIESVKTEIEMLDFSALLTKSILEFEVFAYERGVTITQSLTKHVQIHGDRTQLETLCEVLLDNAIEHTAEGEKVHVKLLSGDSWNTVEVSNPASLSENEDPARWFERFYKGEQAESGAAHYGLGLSIAKAITQSHHGSITARYEDGRVVIRLILPKTAS